MLNLDGKVRFVTEDERIVGFFYGQRVGSKLESLSLGLVRCRMGELKAKLESFIVGTNWNMGNPITASLLGSKSKWEGFGVTKMGWDMHDSLHHDASK